MSAKLQKRAEATLAFARYLSWADLLNTLFEEELANEVPSSDAAGSRKHEWRWYGLMSYWYSSLYVVIEAWDQLGFSDPVIDRLLTHPKQFRELLRRHRNAVFHFQSSLLDPRLIELLEQDVAHVYWIRALHDELIRFYAEHLAEQTVTEEQRGELRENIEALVHWYPHREAPVIESLERTLADVRKVLGKYPNAAPEEREKFERILESGEAVLREGRQNWEALRAQRLREAGFE